MPILNSILEATGNTPLIRLSTLFPHPKVEVLVKVEAFNPSSSNKVRIALSMIEEAETKGILSPNSHIVEPTSGNTGIGLAMVCAVKGYKITLVMPENASLERRKILRAYGRRGGSLLQPMTEFRVLSPRQNQWQPKIP